jgi:hypothetical protein
MMPDLTRLIRLSPGGRPIVLLDLERDDLTFFKARDTFRPVPPARQAVVSTSSSRYEGSQTVGERVENGAVTARYAVKGATADESFANVAALLAQADAVGRDSSIQWRAENATRSTLFERRGPGTWELVDYSANQFRQTGRLLFDVTFPVAPLARGLPMEVADDFSVDSISDYTFDAGAGTLSVSGGQLVPSTTAEKQLHHSARGYSYGDVQASVKVTVGASVGTGAPGVILKRLDSTNYLLVEFTGAALRILRSDAGVLTQLATVAFVPVAGTSYWLRGRIEGNVVYAEVFTAAPTPTGAPSASVSHTLAGADLTKFGAAVVGGVGMRLAGLPATDWSCDDFSIEPYVYRLRSLPAVLDLAGPIPGDAPAPTRVTVAPAAGTTPPWALLAYGRKTGANPPFGILEGEAAANITGWTDDVAEAGARGGLLLSGTITTALAATKAYTASWVVNPADLEAPDPFAPGDLQVEVWARVRLASTLVSPALVASVRPDSALTLGSASYTAEFGRLGRTLVLPSSGTVYRFVRLGSLTLSFDPQAPAALLLWIAGSLAVGSTGTFGLDYLMLVPARARSLSPTGKALGSSYPRFLPVTASARQKQVREDLSGVVSAPPAAGFRDHGLGGSAPALPPGSSSMLVKLSSLVPDDPTVSADTETLVHSATVKVSPAPRYFLARS